MLPNDFVEEYERIEKILVTNNEEFVPDRNGLLIYTTPLESVGNIVNDTVFFQGQNIKPVNANLIIDHVTLLSTNPDCQNYLPLKMRMGTKQDVDFGSPTFRELTDYSIIVNPPINLQTIQNRKYEQFKDYAFITVNQERVTQMVRYGDENRMYYLTQGGEIYWQDLGDSSDGEVDLGTAGTPVQLFANDNQVFFRDANNVWFDIRDVTIPAVQMWDPNNFILPVYVHVGVSLSGTQAFDIYTDASGSTRTVQLIQSNDGYAGLDAQTVSSLSATPNSVGVYNLGRFITWAQISNEIQFSEFEGNEIVEEPVVQIPPNTGTPLGVFIGGPNLSDPLVSLFTSEGGFVKWRTFNKTTPNTFYDQAFDAPIPSLLRRYRNTVYFQLGPLPNKTTSDRYVFCNLDTGVSSIWNISDIEPRTPYPKDYQVMWIDSDVISVYSPEGTAIDTGIRTSVWRSVRPLDKVYSLDYTYDDRAYPYKISGNRFNFTLQLPNNANILDMEIFGYIIDVRVRYTKAKEINNKTLKDDENLGQRGCEKVDKNGKCIKRNKFKREGDVIGTTEEILGISSINASDFLDLYS